LEIVAKEIISHREYREINEKILNVKLTIENDLTTKDTKKYGEKIY
jgi:hypothetical protein